MEPDNDLFEYFVNHELLVRSRRMSLDEEVAYQASKWTLLHPYFLEWRESYQQPPREYWDFMNRVNAEASRRRDEALAAVLKQRDEALAAVLKQRDEAIAALRKQRGEALAAVLKQRDEALAALRKRRDEALAAAQKQSDEAQKTIIQKNNQEQSSEG